MNETLLFITAALGGGLFGAIAQPVVGFYVDGMRSKQRRRKEIERNLRKTVTLWLEFATQAGLTAVEIAARRDRHRPPLSDAEVMHRLRLATHPFPTWQAERIKDARMRQLADRLYDIAVKLPIKLIDPSTPTTDLDASGSEIGQLRRDIVMRMDELDWPEFES